MVEALVDNAWEATRRTPEARIQLGLLTEGGERVHYLRDNGPGFEQGQADTLFEPFRHPEQADAEHSSGIGLALVRRIVHRHEGYVWVEATPGQGATFYFILEPPPPPG
jgi:hypothetical protein